MQISRSYYKQKACAQVVEESKNEEKGQEKDEKKNKKGNDSIKLDSNAVKRKKRKNVVKILQRKI